MSRLLESKPHFQRLKKEHPDLVDTLTRTIHERAIVKRMQTLEALEPVEEKLGRAFGLMVSYGASEEELRM